MTLAGTLATATPARFDPEHDRGESPEPPGTRVFSREIRTAPFPPRFRQPNTLVKYSGETDPAVWLNDYRLACQLGGATEDAVIPVVLGVLGCRKRGGKGAVRISRLNTRVPGGSRDSPLSCLGSKRPPRRGVYFLPSMT